MSVGVLAKCQTIKPGVPGQPRSGHCFQNPLLLWSSIQEANVYFPLTHARARVLRNWWTFPKMRTDHLNFRDPPKPLVSFHALVSFKWYVGVRRDAPLMRHDALLLFSSWRWLAGPHSGPGTSWSKDWAQPPKLVALLGPLLAHACIRAQNGTSAKQHERIPMSLAAPSTMFLTSLESILGKLQMMRMQRQQESCSLDFYRADLAHLQSIIT